MVIDVPKNIEFSYHFGSAGNTFKNGDGTIILTTDYVIELEHSGGVPEKA